jgi:predicted O-methyltransferase YrrM
MQQAFHLNTGLVPAADQPSLLKRIPHFSVRDWDFLFKFVADWKPSRCLDIGFGQGASVACIASALRAFGCDNARVMGIEVEAAQKHSSSVHELLTGLGLIENVTIRYEKHSSNWAFIDLLESTPDPSFDLININSPRTWYAMGLAASVAAVLLSPGGWLILNGVNFTFASSTRRNERWVRKMPANEQTTMQVDKVFNLLIKHNPSFGTLRSYNKCYFARRCSTGMVKIKPMEHDSFESVICELLARSHVDPDFRFDLIWRPQLAYNSLPADKVERLKEIRFCEGTDAVAIGNEFRKNDGCYRLLPPAWCSKMNRAALQELLDHPLLSPLTMP